jgi:outer membrane lipoprotein-sorting protein
MKRRALLQSALVLALPGLAFADALDDKLKEVGAARAKLKTLSGPFTQERTIGLLASKISSTGKLALVRPDRLLWELDAPDSVSYWIGSEGLAYKGKQGQGRLPITSKIAPALDDLRTLLGGDLSALRARYEMKDVTSGKGFAFEAVPKTKENARFQKIVLELAEDLMRPKHVTLVESARDKTEIAFGDLAVNANIDPARMRPPS